LLIVKPLDVCNYLLKYTGDSSLLSPKNSPTPLEMEMAQIMDWARENKMAINLLKTVELVFHRSNVSGDL